MALGESRFRTMFELTADALVVLDVQAGMFIDCNQAALDMLRCRDKSELLTQTPALFSPQFQPDGKPSGEKSGEMIAKAMREGSHRFEWIHRSHHRAEFPVEVLLTPITVGEQQLVIGTLRDITEQKLEQKTQLALHQISEATHAASTLEEMFGQIHEIIGNLLPARNFFVALYNRSRDELTFPYFVDEHDAPPGSRKLDDTTLSGRVVVSGEALLLTPHTVREGVDPRYTLIGTESLDWLGVPLMSNSQTVGALVVQSYTGDVRYVEKDKVLLDFVSSQVASAIERKQAADALLASEKRFRLMFEQNLVGVFRSLPDGRLLECNDALAQMLGYGSSDRVIGVNTKSFYFQDEDRERYLSQLRESGSVNNAEIRLRRVDGSEVWGMQTVNLIRDDQGQPEVLQGTLIDFTERKRIEQELQLSESRLERAQQLGHLGSWTWELSTGTLTWSDELCRIYGVSTAHHQPSFEDYLNRAHPEDRAILETMVSQAMQDHKPFSAEVRIVRPDGEVRTVFGQGEVAVDDHGSVTGMAGVCLDITERKQEEMLEQERSLILEEVVQNRPLPDILARISNMLEVQIPGSLCSILKLKDGRVTTGAAPHLPEAYSKLLDGLPIGPRAGSCGTSMYRRETVIVEDIATDPLWEGYRELALPHGLRACWSMPIPSNHGDLLGSFAVYLGEPARPSARDLDYMAMATRLAAVAMEHRLLNDQLEHQAHHDALTGLPNRVLFQDRLGQAMALAERKGEQVAVLYMDLDRFKSINDMLGHSSGDELLRLAATRLQGCIRNTDTLARLGGDEFTVVLSELGDPQDAMRVASHLVDAMREPFQIERHEVFVSLSLGISIYPADGNDGDTLMANADAAMYRAKETGRDSFQWFSTEMNAEARERMSMDGQLRHALRLGQLSLHYQPQCGVDGAIQGFEALMRWNHPTLGSVSPSRFIPLAEASGLIVQMGDWALRTACAQMASWHRAGHPSMRIAVNVSPVQFKRADWVDTVRHALHDSQLAPEALELEITESLLLQSVSETSANLFELRELGVGVAIDDFGTGYSSLSYLHTLPVTTLKIDQAFVHGIGRQSLPGQEDAPIIRTIIALARNLGLSVVAEGVETAPQRDLLVSLGCESLQGYLLHRPMPVEQVDRLLAASGGGE